MKCLRCGREIEEGASFCKDCLKEVEKPLEESPYLSTQIVLPSRKPRPRPQPVSPVSVKDSKPKKKKGRKGLIASVCILSVFCLLLTGSCLWLLREEIFGFDPADNEKRLLEEENSRLSNDLSAAQKDLSEKTTTADDLREENQELKVKVSHLEETLNGDRMEQSEMDLSLRELQEQQKTLMAQVNESRERIKAMEKQQKDTEAEKEQLTADLVSLRSKNDSLQSTVNFIDRHIAFINSGSKVYHRLSCPNFSLSRGWFAMNISEAKQEGYVPCPDCQ